MSCTILCYSRKTVAESDSDSNPIISREIDDSRTVSVDPDYVYAVFVTYVEIYNNSVYDLLDLDELKAK